MGDYVQVNPERLDQLAAALKSAAGLIPDKAQSMSNAISGWEGDWDAGKVKALGTWLEGQWAAMEDRADLAYTANRVTRAYSPDDPHGSWPGIPWTITPEDKANEGLQDAGYYKSVLTDDDYSDDQKDQAQRELTHALTAHKDDPTWLQAFWGNGGAEAVDASNKRLLGDHVPVSDSAQQSLAVNAAGVALASKMSEAGQITLPDGSFSTLYDGDSVMATGVMTKFGPSGDTYGSQFLADTGQAAIDWRKDHQPARPGYSPANFSQGQVEKWVQDDDAWWDDYGLELHSATTDSISEQRAKVELMRAYDPSVNILNVVGDNESASQRLLSGDKGADNAQALVDYSWSTPGIGDDSAAPGKVIRAATMDRKPPADEASARAAANVFGATQHLYANDWRNDYDKEQYPRIPAGLAQSLSAMGTAYLPDLAASTTGSSGSTAAVKDPETGQWVVQSNQTDLSGYLGILTQDPKAAGAFQAGVNSQLTNAAAASQKWPKEATDLLQQTGYLNGMTQIAVNQRGYSEAEAKDEQNARNATYFDIATGLASAVPLGEIPKYAEFLKGATETAAGASKDALFPQDAADQADSQAQYDTNQKLSDMRVYVAQGYANAGSYPTPKDATFVHGGVIAPSNDEEQAAFDRWYSQMPKSLADQNDASQGYQDAAGQYAHGDDKFQHPEG